MGKIMMIFVKITSYFICRKQSLTNNGLNTIYHPYTTQFNGQTPLSQIVASGPSPVVDSSSILFDSFCTKRRKQSTMVSTSLSSSKRGVLPKSATSIMRSWLFQHIVNDLYFVILFLNFIFFLKKGSSLSN